MRIKWVFDDDTSCIWYTVKELGVRMLFSPRLFCFPLVSLCKWQLEKPWHERRIGRDWMDPADWQVAYIYNYKNRVRTNYLSVLLSQAKQVNDKSSGRLLWFITLVNRMHFNQPPWKLLTDKMLPFLQSLQIIPRILVSAWMTLAF